MDRMNITTNVAVNRNNPLNSLHNESPALPKKEAKASAEDFSAELSAAGTAQAAQALLLQAQANQPKPEAKLLALQAAEGAERSPATQTTAASMTAGAAIAGLKPWDSGWVMQGMGVDVKGHGIEMQPLFGQADPAATQAPASPTGQQLNIPSNLNSKGVSDEDVQKALQSLAKTRGEAAEAMSQLNQAVQAQDLSPLGKAGAGVDHLAAQASMASQSLNGNANPLQVALGNGAETSFVAAEGLRNGNENGSGPMAAGGYPALSGAEYLTTLNAVRGAQSHGSQSQTGSGGGQDTGGELGFAKGAPVSKDDGLKGKKLQFGDAMQATLNNGVGMHAAGGSHNMAGAGSVAKTEMTGHVVKGAMSQDRLSTESLMGISDNIRNLSAQGAGEIRVRLRPDHLGELQVRVTTQGNQVGLQIQASDANAKRILEESMSHLKDSLAAQNLSLAQVDLTVAGGQMSSGLNGGSHQDSSHGQSPSHQQHLGQGWNQAGNQPGHQSWNQGGNGQMSSWHDSGLGMNRAPAASAAGALRSGAAGARAVQADGRLDVKA